MSASRRAEIEAKRARLAELRRAREERAELERAERARDGDRSRDEIGRTRPARHDIDELVASLVGNAKTKPAEAPENAAAAAPATTTPPASTAPPASSTPPASTAPPAATTAPQTTQPAPAEPPAARPTENAQPPAAQPPEKVLYTKMVQTDAPEEHADEHASAAAHDGPAAEPSPTSPPTRADPAPQAAPLDVHAVAAAPEYAAFVETSARIVERALHEPYDLLTDYAYVPPAGGARDESAIGHVATLHTDTFAGRSVAALDWSTKHPELVVAGYTRAKTPVSLDDHDGLAAVWNVHAPHRPEFVFRAPTDVLSVLASPFHPHLFVGGTYSGQVLLWDTRHRGVPVQRSPLAFAPGAAQGHAAPVYSLAMPGTASAHELVSASTDGTVCTWALDMLGRPQDVLSLTNAQHPRSPDVSVASFGVLPHDTQRLCLGTTEGNIFTALRTDRAGARAGLELDHVYVGHSAPVTRVAFHPAGSRAPVDLGDLFLSSSMDWSVALWRVASARAKPTGAYHYPHADARVATSTRSNPLAFRAGAAPAWTPVAPLARFESEHDYCMDVQWHPQHPALFAQVDAAGRLDVYNLAKSTEKPALSTRTDAGLNRLSWERCESAARVAAGGFDGRIHVYQLADALVRPTDADWRAMQRWLAST
ncbi:hypothetical protein MCUN1_002249 [Malassezia cuniculi]|uniref:Cytoplasmic dynein 1 intermediate chain 2 n=1 Tax=Malassezia cuniculi TaxID=948313 RepID=A0AAF0ERR0_9BASI|nr:hypothetical protein MCUN1_002249 [Malassezia cuniculi]